MPLLLGCHYHEYRIFAALHSPHPTAIAAACGVAWSTEQILETEPLLRTDNALACIS
eukprot:CAMPEP_0177753258 /NCGR_PEP_ID=MMETSP0491_2-20121128/1358_1 /TAXON_ID=63592 /ORGANISM="Tetraselmis chuii, Strain PLY429" /LENGTH=56 /DNA_ID=CAMNT_0019268519 /DNA_START=94 /DNA_END=264 /DNA_ORIENTATION=+